MVDFSILIVDDEEDIRSGLKDLLGIHNFEVDTAQDGVEALELYNKYQYSLIVSDIMMPGMTGIELSKQIKTINPDTYVVLFTGYSSIDNAVEAIKSGAEEYLQKPINNDELLGMVARIYSRVELKTTNDILRQEILRQKTIQIIGKSSGIKKVNQEIKQVSNSDIPVLITGDTGTGKELVARAIHEYSSRNDQPFVAINCAAIPADLLESELFGHERGAFSGAVTRKFGLFEVANKGTILLDEIGEMSASLQPKILRTIETGQFRRLGGQKEYQSDFRVISSTNRNLKKMVGEGAFREDLFYRLSPFIIDVPPLHKRKSDIPLLVDYFTLRRGRQDSKIDSDSEFVQALKNYHWPGNIRELQNALERVFLLAGNNALSINYLPPEIKDVNQKLKNELGSVGEMQALSGIESNHIAKIYRELGGNKVQAAKALGISLRSLYNKLEKYDIKK